MAATAVPKEPKPSPAAKPALAEVIGSPPTIIRPMKIRFTKMQGAGNDFVVLDETQGRLGLTPAHYRLLADRQVRTALINLDTGESVSLDALILDETALEERLTACVEGYQEQLNTYLDANDLLPVPLDSVCFTPRGLLIHYPAERFSFFSGNSGAVLIRYDLLADLLPAGVSPQDGLTAGQLAQQVRDAAAQGYLAGMPELRVGESLHAALTAYGTLTEPDYIENGEIFEFESPLFYGAYAVAPRGAEDDEAALITAVRSREICLGGLSTGAAAQQDVIALLGEPQASVEISAETAEYNRLPVGNLWW